MSISYFVGFCCVGIVLSGTAVDLEKRGGTAIVYTIKVEMFDKRRSRLKVLLFSRLIDWTLIIILQSRMLLLALLILSVFMIKIWLMLIRN